MRNKEYDVISTNMEVIFREYENILKELDKSFTTKDAIDAIYPYAYFLNNRFKYIADFAPVSLTKEIKLIGELQTKFYKIFGPKIHKYLIKMNIDISLFAQVTHIVYNNYSRFCSLGLRGVK